MCSFGTKDLEIDKSRFLNQAKSFKIFKDIFIYGLNDLDEKTKKLIDYAYVQDPKTKGYNHGYFIWKPEIVEKTFDKIPENSFLLYADIGCFLNVKGKNCLYNYINICEKFLCLGFQYRQPDKPIKNICNTRYQKYLEFNYTKTEVFIGSLLGPIVALPGIFYIGSPLHILEVMGLVAL